MSVESTDELRAKLAEAESIIEALRGGKVDAVVGDEQIALLRLREVEEALRRSEARYRGIVEDQADLVFRWNREGRLTFINEAFCRWLAQTRERLEGSHVSAALPADTNHRDIWAELTATEGAERPSLDQEEPVTSPTGERRWLNITHRLIHDDEGETEIQSVARDVTERRCAQEQLRELNADLEQRVEQRTAQLKRLLNELDEAEQRERRRLAQFLHDDLQQLLVASKFTLTRVRQQATDETQSAAADRAAELLDRSLSASRSLMSQLSPTELQESGLLAGLEWLGEQMHEMHQVPVAVEGDPRAEPRNHQLRDLLFSFAREVVFNAIKHARPSQVWVTTRRRGDGHIEIGVRDDGDGFDADARVRAQQHQTGLGLWRIEERLQLLGGWLEVDSAPGAGARITLVAPASADADGEE